MMLVIGLVPVLAGLIAVGTDAAVLFSHRRALVSQADSARSSIVRVEVSIPAAGASSWMTRRSTRPDESTRFHSIVGVPVRWLINACPRQHLTRERQESTWRTFDAAVPP